MRRKQTIEVRTRVREEYSRASEQVVHQMSRYTGGREHVTRLYIRTCSPLIYITNIAIFNV